MALTYPLHVIMKILGVPEKDEPRMLGLTKQFFGAAGLDPEISPPMMHALAPEQFANMVHAALMNFEEYFKGISNERRKSPRDDLASVLANAKIDDKPIPDRMSTGYYVIVATAGHDTTSSSIATALWALAENPAKFAKVKSNPALIPSLVEEAIRWATPIKTFMRTATADTTLAGRNIAKGDWLMLCLCIRQPRRVDVQRPLRLPRRP